MYYVVRRVLGEFLFGALPNTFRTCVIDWSTITKLFKKVYGASLYCGGVIESIL